MSENRLFQSRYLNGHVMTEIRGEELNCVWYLNIDNKSYRINYSNWGNICEFIGRIFRDVTNHETWSFDTKFSHKSDLEGVLSFLMELDNEKQDSENNSEKMPFDKERYKALRSDGWSEFGKLENGILRAGKKPETWEHIAFPNMEVVPFNDDRDMTDSNMIVVLACANIINALFEIESMKTKTIEVPEKFSNIDYSIMASFTRMGITLGSIYERWKDDNNKLLERLAKSSYNNTAPKSKGGKSRGAAISEESEFVSLRIRDLGNEILEDSKLKTWTQFKDLIDGKLLYTQQLRDIETFRKHAKKWFHKNPETGLIEKKPI